MSEHADEKKLVLEIELHQEKTGDDPVIPVFRVQLRNNDWVTKDGFGSDEAVNAFLLGVGRTLSMMGHSVSMRWFQADDYAHRRGKRWTIRDGDLPEEEDLDAEGNVIPPI